VVHRGTLSGMEARHLLRQVINMINLSTPLGLLLAYAGGNGVRRGERGILIGDGYRLPLPIAPAFTVGNVVMFRDARQVTDCLLAHEERHATQYSWCLGVFMLLPYFVFVGVSMVVCGDHASYNPFERRAGLLDGGYTKRDPRWRVRDAR
jgi:hypothetical protein